MKYFLFFILIFNCLWASDFIAKLDNNQPQCIVTYGTSLTSYWPEEIKEIFDVKYPGLLTVINSGIPGSCSKQGVENINEYVNFKKPDIVFIEFSINDSYEPYQISCDTSRKNLNLMIDSILTFNPSCKIILMTMNIPIREHLIVRPFFEAYYQIYRDIAKERNFLLIDHYWSWKEILDKNPSLYEQYVSDGIHPGEEGCREVILPEIIKSFKNNR